MADIQPIFADEKTAASLFCLPQMEFRRLVREGHLPKGEEIAPNLKRWNVDALRRIATGAAASGEMEW